MEEEASPPLTEDSQVVSSEVNQPVQDEVPAENQNDSSELATDEQKSSESVQNTEEQPSQSTEELNEQQISSADDGEEPVYILDSEPGSSEDDEPILKSSLQQEMSTSGQSNLYRNDVFQPETQQLYLPNNPPSIDIAEAFGLPPNRQFLVASAPNFSGYGSMPSAPSFDGYGSAAPPPFSMHQSAWNPNPNLNAKADFFRGPPPTAMNTRSTFNSVPNDPVEHNRTYLTSLRNSMDRGSQLIADVFSRADLSDDGALTYEEFHQYFADGVLNDDQLLILFNMIDSDSSGNISVEQLFTYFRMGFDPYADLFSALAKVHGAISASLMASYQNYVESSESEQFKTRFYLREFIRQIEALKEPIDSALDTTISSEQQQLQSQIITEKTEEDSKSSRILTAIEKITNLAERLKNYQQLTQNSFETDTFIVVSRNFWLIPEMIQQFTESIQFYMDRVVDQPGCRTAYIRPVPDRGGYCLHEIWDDDDNLRIHNLSGYFKQFQKSVIDCVSAPVDYQTINLPQSWWVPEYANL